MIRGKSLRASGKNGFPAHNLGEWCNWKHKYSEVQVGIGSGSNPDSSTIR